MIQDNTAKNNQPDLHPYYDWTLIARLLLTSRAIDELEETQLIPERKIIYQFSAKGHDLGQIMLGSLLNNTHDAVSGYYRSRPLLLSLGLEPEDALAGPLMRAGSFSSGRDIGVVFNYPNPDGPCVLPMAGGVGTQYTPVAGWAQSIDYHKNTLKDSSYNQSIAVVHGGDGSVATNGFWSALTMATTLKLPMLFYIEDNGFGLSVPSTLQTPGGDISANLASFQQLTIFKGDGSDPVELADLVEKAVAITRQHQGPVLLHVKVPRLSGHSAQDTQAYKSEEQIAQEKANDPLPKLKNYLIPALFSSQQWQALENEVNQLVATALEKALARPEADASIVEHYIFAEQDETGQPKAAIRGGLRSSGYQFPKTTTQAMPQGGRINMLTAIRMTLAHELKTNPKVVVFGEDVGPKGGVHGATLGLQDQFGKGRVFDTSLSEEGIIGRALGLAMSGLMPVPEIQFRKYADPATEQINDCGTIRWRTFNQFAAPMVIRIPGGHFKCGDPWHSACNEVEWAHAVGWQLLFPSNAQDAVGLLRSALRSDNPTIFFEHRAMLDHAYARRPYPGDDFIVPLGQACMVATGEHLTVVTWGAMVERCVQASEKVAQEHNKTIDVLDLRSLIPWDKEAVLNSVAKTNRCLIVHEDSLTAGFGAEIAATLARDAFFDLDAPIERLTMPDIPSPHSPLLLQAVVPSVDKIYRTMVDLLAV